MINSLILSGRMGKDPVGKIVNNGTKLMEGTLAFKTFKGETRWLDWQAWGKTADFVEQYVKKGMLITFQGRIECDEWEDKQTGQKRQKHYLVVNDLQLPEREAVYSEPEEDVDVPF